MLMEVIRLVTLIFRMPEKPENYIRQLFILSLTGYPSFIQTDVYDISFQAQRHILFTWQSNILGQPKWFSWTLYFGRTQFLTADPFQPLMMYICKCNYNCIWHFIVLQKYSFRSCWHPHIRSFSPFWIFWQQEFTCVFVFIFLLHCKLSICFVIRHTGKIISFVIVIT